LNRGLCARKNPAYLSATHRAKQLQDWTEMNVLRRDFVVREPLLVAILVLITIAFSTITRSYTLAYDRRRTALGQQWYANGDAELQQHRPDAAVEAFRTALLYVPQNWEYRLRLAEALTQAGHTNQALSYYQSLWQLDPHNGIVNLHLARFAASGGQVADAERYFNGAIFGAWTENAADHRRESLFELVNFYLQRGETAQAESQLIILSGNLPEDPVLHARVAELYSKVGDNQRALAQYRQAIQLDPQYFSALYGAGKAAFHMGDYRAAESYLSRAAPEDSTEPDAKNLLEIAHAASSLNPYEHGLRESEKIQRVLHAFQIASTRLDACAQTSGSTGSLPPFLIPLQEPWQQWKASATLRSLTQRPEQIDPLFEFSTGVEKQSQSLCGAPTPEDSALLALASVRTADEK
jgi:tetratricopeptide (TPR) repeat protein